MANKEKSKEEKNKEAEKIEVDELSDEEPDYGGLPARDLKKNLGCG